MSGNSRPLLVQIDTPVARCYGDGASTEPFLAWFPGVEREQVEAVLYHEVKALARGW
tara:strand:+ start:121 stop:291 length:171 start_codon:yes stop_codon:yes gene_type:complete